MIEEYSEWEAHQRTRLHRRLAGKAKKNASDQRLDLEPAGGVNGIVHESHIISKQVMITWPFYTTV